MRIYLASLFVLLGENGAAANQEATMNEAESDGMIMAYYLAGAYLTQGNADRAVFWLRRIVEQGGVHVYGVRLMEEHIGVDVEEYPEVVEVLGRHRDEEARLRRLF